MRLFEKCPVCGGEITDREVEKLLKGDGNTAVLTVRAEVCLHCGERLYPVEAVRLFEDIRKRLKEGNTEEFVTIGKSYQVTQRSTA